jgi:hypothetical protein
MVKEPSKQDIQELIAFLPVFAAEGFDPISDWSGGELLPGGAYSFPFPVYHPAVERFFQLAGKEPWCDYEYMKKDVPALLQDPDFLPGASLDEIKSLLTFCVRGERFCDGHWGDVIREGLVQRVLERLTAILQEI